jgi:putative heme iron utilization protein
MIPDKTTPQSTARASRQLLRAHRYGALSTLSKKFDGHPFGSITPYLVEHDGSLFILISALAEHTKNIQRDPRVSLITHNQEDPHIQTQGRITVVGTASLVAEREQAGKRYLRYFPETQTYFDMPDFEFYRIVPQALRYIGGFGDIHWIKAENYLAPAYPLIAQAEELIAEINDTQRAALWRLAMKHHPGKFELVGIDCDGFDLRSDQHVLRFDFPTPQLDAAQARAELVRLSEID